MAIVVGNPAHIVGYVGAGLEGTIGVAARPERGTIGTSVAGVTINRLPFAQDLRGMLSAGEIGIDVPFEVKRYFVVFGVPGKEVRGEHAHRTLHQFLVCVHGECHVVADDGDNRQEFVLDHPSVGVYLPPMVWATQYKYTENAVLLVLASERYDASDYVRDYSEFLRLARSRQ
jgi:dTDP-4-dehydrorhamnose 3,5-epimerase-like enzyme